jgi:hypothetical protein
MPILEAIALMLVWHILMYVIAAACDAYLSYRRQEKRVYDALRLPLR